MSYITIRKDLVEITEALAKLSRFLVENPEYVDVSDVEDSVSLLKDEVLEMVRGHIGEKKS